MHNNCSEKIGFFDLLVDPQKSFPIKDKKGNEYLIKAIDIFYIVCKESDKYQKYKRDIKTIYFCSPIVINGKLQQSFDWYTKKSLDCIVDELGVNTFVQINKRTIVRSVLIQGRDSAWKNIQLIANDTNTLSNTKWQSKKLALGRKYKSSIVKVFNIINLIEVKNNNGIDELDVLFINPVDIVYIELSKQERIIHLNKPFYNNGINCYQVKWKSRLKVTEMVNYFHYDNIVQSNRNTIINLNYIVGNLQQHQDLVQLTTDNKTFIGFKMPEQYYKMICNQ